MDTRLTPSTPCRLAVNTPIARAAPEKIDAEVDARWDWRVRQALPTCDCVSGW